MANFLIGNCLISLGLLWLFSPLAALAIGAAGIVALLMVILAAEDDENEKGPHASRPC